MSIKTLSVNCPTCKKEVLMVEASQYRPFCSKRCRDIDFGDWAAEKNVIPGRTEDAEAWSDDLDDTSF